MKNDYQIIQKMLGEGLKTDHILAPYTTFKIGGPADLFYDAKTTDDLVRVVSVARKYDIPVFVLGGGTNILIGDKGIRGFVVKNSTSRIAIVGLKGQFRHGKSEGNVYVEADSGVPMNKLIRFTIEEGIAGLEMQLGLPGTVGGAVYMNSKWTHPTAYVGDVVYQAHILTRKGEQKDVPQSYFHFAYDTSTIQKTGDIVLSVTFCLRSSRTEDLWKVANESMEYRRLTQPQGVFSPGCTFRNLTKSQAIASVTPNRTTSAGFLIDHAGLKNTSVGDASISPVHANFIINKGHATARDVVELIENTRQQVKRQFGVDLEEEIIRVGEF